ncbi:MAG: glucose 1-dehydrogenase [Chloroflexia bacterium]|nr:glucose 1-dehydrogenase [Chloroflexia bacterium]
MTDGHETTLTGKVAIVTGAGSGVGQATALALTVAGAIPVLVGRTPGPLAATAAAISMAGGRSLVAAADVADEAAVERLVERAVAELGGVDLLLAAAGIGRFGLVVGYALADWQATLATILTGVFLCARAAVPAMRARGGGSIVNLASVAAERPQPGMGVYCVSKAAVLMLTDVLAAELAADGIRVNALVPGFVKTRFTSVLWQDEATRAALLGHIPQRRMAEPEEIASAALYLASDAARFVTGAHLRIDGGQLVAPPVL